MEIRITFLHDGKKHVRVVELGKWDTGHLAGYIDGSIDQVEGIVTEIHITREGVPYANKAV